MTEWQFPYVKVAGVFSNRLPIWQTWSRPPGVPTQQAQLSPMYYLFLPSTAFILLDALNSFNGVFDTKEPQ